MWPDIYANNNHRSSTAQARKNPRTLEPTFAAFAVSYTYVDDVFRQGGPSPERYLA